MFATVSDGIASSRKWAFAFIHLGNSKLIQYSIDSEGKFTEVAPFGPYADSRIITDPKGRFIYVIDGRSIYWYKVTRNNKLARCGRVTSKIFGASRGVFDKSGRFLYLVTYDRYDSSIRRMNVRSDGSLAFSNYRKISIKEDTVAIAIHPEKPYLYTLHTPNLFKYEYSYIMQFRINENGSLTPLKPRDVHAGSDLAGLAFSHDGRYLYSSQYHYMDIAQFQWKTNGQLKPMGELNYGIPQELPDFMGRMPCFHGANIVAAPNGHGLLVSDDEWRALYSFVIKEDGHLLYDDMYYTDGSKFVRDSKLWKEAEAHPVPLSEEEKAEGYSSMINKAYYQLTANLTTARLTAAGPNGILYSLSHMGVFRFKVKTDGSLQALGWAIKFPKDWWDKNAKLKTDGVTLDMYPVNQFTIVSN